MKIYTRTGDEGETGLFGGRRVSKSHRRVEAFGSVDELNAFLGQALIALAASESVVLLGRIQHDLFTIGSVLSTPPAEGGRTKPQTPALPEQRVGEMEERIDRVTELLEPLQEFILPGGSPGAAALHVARTVCRRAERSVAALAAEEAVEPGIIVYLNRLSDLLFALARLENHWSGRPDVVWKKEETPQ